MNLAFLNAIAGGGRAIASGLGDYSQSVQHQQDLDQAESDRNDAQQAARDVQMAKVGYYRRPDGSTSPTPGPTPVTGATPLTTSLQRATIGPQLEDDNSPQVGTQMGTPPVMSALNGAAKAPTKSITIGSDTYDQDLGRTPEGAAQRKSEAQTSTNMAAISTWVNGLSASDPRRAQYSQGVIQALAANPTSFSNWAEHAAGTANIDPNSPQGIQAAVSRHQKNRAYDVAHQTSTPGWQVAQTDKGLMRVNTQTGQVLPLADPTGSGGNTGGNAVLQPKTTTALTSRRTLLNQQISGTVARLKIAKNDALFGEDTTTKAQATALAHSLQQRLDSLVAVQDEMGRTIADQTGAQKAAGLTSAVTPPPITQHPATADFDAAAAKYKHALSLRIDPGAALQAYNSDIADIARKHKLLKE